MNKKFSTLVASILLASSIGTVSAVTPDFVKYKDQGSVATSVKQGAAFQLSAGEGQVLALARTLTQNGFKYDLKMVAADNSTNLAETLWKITYTENKEGGPSFTFVSAAYGIPLSFTPKNVDENGVISEYPGTDGLWKWLPSLNVTGTNTFAPTALVNNYSAKLDSAVVLATSGSKVVAQRYKTSGGVPSNALRLQPIVAASVVLGADDLNSMMLTQDADSKFKLTFNEDVKGSEIGNLWTKGMLKAEPAKYLSPVVYSIEGAADATYYSADEATAAAAGYEAAKAINTAAYAQGLINDVSVDEAVSAFKSDVAAAAIGDNFAAAVTAAKAITAAETLEINTAAANLAAATAVKTQVDGISPTPAHNTTKAAIEAAFDAGNVNAGIENDAKTELAKLFAALVTGNITDQEGLTALNNSVAGLANVLKNHGQVEEVQTGTKEGVQTVLKALPFNDSGDYDALLEALVPAVNGTYTVEGANELLGLLDAAVEELEAAYDGLDIALAQSFKDAYLEALAGYKETVTGDDFTADNVTTVVDAAIASLDQPAGTDTDAGCKAFVNAALDKFVAVENADKLTEAITAIDAALDAVEPADVKTAAEAAAKGAADSNTVGDEIAAALGAAYDDAVAANPDLTLAEAIAAITATGIEQGGVKDPGQGGTEVVEEEKLADYVMLSLDKKTKVNNNEYPLYLAVDTNFVTSASGRRNLTFAEWYYNMPKKSNGSAMTTAMQRDYNGHFNFKFTYYPTQDSLDIITDGYAMLPAEGVKNWVDINDPKPTYSYEGNGKTVMLAVLADTHTEATVGEPQNVSGTSRYTINTRIGFNIDLAEGAKIEEGVYTIQYISYDADNKNENGRYLVANWLPEGQAIAKVEDQNLNHIPAAQWMLSHNNGSNINTIVNRESGENFYYYANTSYLPVQYLYATATDNLYTTVYGDSLKLSKITDKVALADSTLGYYAAAKYNEETADQLEVYALRYLNEIEDLFVNYTEKDSILNVTKAEEAEAYFRLIPVFDAVQYGASNEDIAKDLYRQAYYIQLETPNKNVKDEDKLYISRDVNGKYRLITRKYEKIDDKNVLTWTGVKPFLLKEFKEVDGTCNYAIIEATSILNEKEEVIGYKPSTMKISVKDYPSILITEKLEGEMKGWYGLSQDGRTSTFALIQKDAPKYRRLNVTDAEDGLKDMDVNNAEFFVTRNPNRFLYENTINKVAGYESDPLGLNFLGDFNVKELEKNAAMFVDTAYVRNNTNRPQYMLALRPDFTPDTIPCEAHPSTHPYDLVDQVRASYLVTLSDSVANAGSKVEQNKFTYENRKYTRLAFVDAIHRGDEFIIMSSKFTGTDKAANDTIDLSKNAFVEGAWQFRLTGNEGAEFYIEGAANNNFIRLINGVAVLTDDITDAERFNITTTEKNPTANDAISANKVTVEGGNGYVTIKGAAGKTVSISNVLGQTTSTKVTSDNATIAAPAGIVVVAVEGEAAVKAIVK